MFSFHQKNFLHPPSGFSNQPMNQVVESVLKWKRTVTTPWKMWNLKITQIKQENHKPLLLCEFSGVYQWATWPLVVTAVWLKLKVRNWWIQTLPVDSKNSPKVPITQRASTVVQIWKIEKSRKTCGLGRCFFFFKGGIISFRGCIPHRADRFHTSFLVESASDWLSFDHRGAETKFIKSSVSPNLCLKGKTRETHDEAWNSTASNHKWWNFKILHLLRFETKKTSNQILDGLRFRDSHSSCCV